MYIEEIRIRNFKNFKSEKILLHSGVDVILGENDSGKTNLLQAIRLVLDKKMSWYERDIKEEFFSHCLPEWRGHIIIISIIFNELRYDNEFESMLRYETMTPSNKGSISLFIIPKGNVRASLYGQHNPEDLMEKLNKITIDDYEMIYTAGLDVDYTNEDSYLNLVGDFAKGEYKLNYSLDDRSFGCRNIMIDKIKNELMDFTYIDALRDAVREMNQKSNPLMTLIKIIEPYITPDEKIKVKESISKLNDTISSVTEINKLSNKINNKISDSVGNTFSSNIIIKSAMSDEIKTVFRNLRIKSANEFELGLEGIGLGTNNIIYIALKLLENMILADESKKFFLLLFEEPEAHLHKHLQMTLFEKTKIYEQNNVQIILTTHSDNISASSKIGNMSIIQKEGNYSKIINPVAGLAPQEIFRIERYLDVKRSELLFSKSVLLVEGDAEEILIPIMVRKVLGLSLDEIGVSLINIGSVGFKNIYKLFNPQRITKKCAIISDLDKPIDESCSCTAYQRGISRQEEIMDEHLVNEYVKGFFGEYTLEVSLVPNNIDYIDRLVLNTYTSPKTITESQNDIRNKDVSVYGNRMLSIANYNGKGWNAVLLSEIIDAKFNIPDYILSALLFVAQPMLKAEKNIRTMLSNYAQEYGDSKMILELRDNKIPIETMLDFAEYEETQIIKFIKDIML